MSRVGASHAGQLTIDAAFVYEGGSDGITRTLHNGGPQDPLLKPSQVSQPGMYGLVNDQRFVYWLRGTELGRVAK
jgi:hypothetical protein